MVTQAEIKLKALELALQYQEGTNAMTISDDPPAIEEALQTADQIITWVNSGGGDDQSDNT